MLLQKKWQDLTWVAFDTETSGKYPLGAEVCEIAAVKWRDGKVIDEFQSFCQVSEPMSDEVIAIHNITNDMLKGAPSIKKVVTDFNQFIDGSILLAHHAPFDLGFLAYEFENYNIPLPTPPVVCTSLLSRKVIIETPNHRLQTLIKHLDLPKRQAHRALSDAEGCLDVAMKCFARLQEKHPDLTLGKICDTQSKPLYWAEYSIDQLRQKQEFRAIIEALKAKEQVQIIYMGGSRPGEKRTVTPLGLVRTSINQEFLVAQDDPNEHPKRYFLDKIKSSTN